LGRWLASVPLILLAGLILCTTLARESRADNLAFPQGAVTAKEIDGYLDYLAKKKKRFQGKPPSKAHDWSLPWSPLEGKGPFFMDAGQTYNLDPRLLVAISGIETNFGTQDCAAENAWNWEWHGPCRSPFRSLNDGIITVSKFLRRNYLNKGYNTVALIQKKYCPGNAGWASTVTTFRNQMAGLAPVPSLTGETPTQTNANQAQTNYLRVAMWVAVGVLALGLAFLVGVLIGGRGRAA
jgi:hypothetical protein